MEGKAMADRDSWEDALLDMPLRRMIGWTTALMFGSLFVGTALGAFLVRGL
jgi:hypothetical protein